MGRSFSGHGCVFLQGLCVGEEFVRDSPHNVGFLLHALSEVPLPDFPHLAHPYGSRFAGGGPLDLGAATAAAVRAVASWRIDHSKGTIFDRRRSGISPDSAIQAVR